MSFYVNVSGNTSELGDSLEDQAIVRTEEAVDGSSSSDGTDCVFF